jgi:hypothetical protein
MQSKGTVPSDPESIRMRAGAPAGEALAPSDPWGNAWRVTVDPVSGRARIESAGPDGSFDTEDDVRDTRIAPDADATQGASAP